MCGLVGYRLVDGLQEGTATLEAMLATIRHRGPDDEGIALFRTATGAYENVLTDESEVDRSGARTHPIPHDIGFGHDYDSPGARSACETHLPSEFARRLLLSVDVGPDSALSVGAVVGS